MPQQLQGRNGSIWLCTGETFQECLDRNLFGDRNPDFGRDRIQEGEVCFLLHLGRDSLYGVFVAASPPGWDLEAGAWQGRFRYQVRVKPMTRVRGGWRTRLRS